ncbi:hypothetical protein GJ697_15690 [Pseudoduganella sp. FT25W]|uniref:GGDEF domain-containing protein n=1 Tax=Duganella alba TaxID=2666081 RepID=A0A6L5QI10_9BURK|nr:GGDEF domain-containing protein [Duganella alba]MRX09285.1 hypothetical protein [Duganella alba]MRX17193.1 hypothetical protein [Duganella alba]
MTSLLVQMAVTAACGVLGAFYTELFPNFFAPHPANLLFALAANVTVVMSMVAILLAHREEAARELERLACTDGVTGALNRRAWTSQAEQVVADSQRLRAWLAEAGPRDLGLPLNYSAKMLGRNLTLDEQALEVEIR